MRTRARGGFALMAVLIVLLALFVLCAPFLMTARNADRSSGQLTDRAEARILLDAAARHARARLGSSHAGFPDESPFADSTEELEVNNSFPEGFLQASDPRGSMWDLSVQDVSGLIDLNSAPPQLMATMMGMTSRLSSVMDNAIDEMPINDPAVFTEGEGFLVIRGEVISYRTDESGRISSQSRGVGAYVNDEGEWATDGPRPPSGHPVGAQVMDQRAFAPVLWRVTGADDTPRSFDNIEQLREADMFAMVGVVGDASYRALSELGSVHGGVCAGDTWQHPVRLTSPISGGKTLSISVDDARYLNEGATIWVSDGERGELRYIQGRSNNGRVFVNYVFEEDYDAWETDVRVMSRRPVNVNTAPAKVLEALFTNLQLRGHNSRITAGEARALAALTIESRPFDGLEDWMLRIVLPAAGIEELPSDAPVVPESLAGTAGAVIQASDALALYANSLNANDSLLVFSTMPLCFTSRDVYAMWLRASVNSKSGLEKTHASRDRVEWIVPQRELFSMWATQQDFDEALRLTRKAPWWMTGPSATSHWDGGTSPPSRVWPNMGTFGGQAYLPGYHRQRDNAPGEGGQVEHMFASRDEHGWAQLWPSRIPEEGRYNDRVLHFDRETRDPEGRFLPDETIAMVVDDDMVGWAEAAQGGMMLPASFELWVKPTVLGDGYLLDVAGSSQESDRVSLLMEGEDLVLRLLDGFGDHLDTAGFREASELRFALAEGEDPGLPNETWSHVYIDVAGSRPDQLRMLVNGSASGVRRMGMSRLAAPASQGGGLLALDSTDGFPARGVVRLGNELVEYVLQDGGLSVEHQDTGPDAGQGGRTARTRWSIEGIPANLGSITTDHPVGTSVSVYGYSAPLASNLPSGGSALADELGPFKVARVIGLDGQEDPILGGFMDFGDGYEAENMSGLMLALADDPEGDSDGAQVMSSFNASGGYAALVQQRWTFDETGVSAVPPNAPLGGVEVIRYSGYSSNILHVAARGADVANELPRYGELDPLENAVGGVRVFVIDWEGTVDREGDLLISDMEMGFYCVPISISAPGADDIGYLLPEEEESEFAQLTRLGEAEMTEWVRYDTIQTAHGQLVRDDPGALLTLYGALTRGQGSIRDFQGSTDQPPGDGPGGAGGGGGGGAYSSAPAAPEPAAAAGPVWDPLLGESELDELYLSHSVASRFQFRGVLGTHSHTHPGGTLLLPVFKLPDRGVEGGRPGARDAIFVSGPDPTHIGWPLVVHRAHLSAAEYLTRGWQQDPGGALVALPGDRDGVETPHQGFNTRLIYVALQSACPEPIAFGGDQGVGTNTSDPRLLARITKFPSGERPRIVTSASVGSSFEGQASAVPSATVDEVAFGTPRFLRGLPGANPASHTQGAQMVLATAMDDASEQMDLLPRTFMVTGGRTGSPPGTLDQLPDDGGLLQVGDEILAYTERDSSTGELVLAPGGRGLLGTEPQPHQPTEVVTFLEGWEATSLAGQLSASDGNLPIESASGFPSHGTVLIGNELIHYTRRRSGSLEMPRARSTAEDSDAMGRGLFRGRYGTASTAHEAGTAVILFPFRYWDRWAERADVPELSYFGIELEQPGAWWLESFWDTEPTEHGQCHIGVLVRTDRDTPWDADPDEERNLDLQWEGRLEGEMVPLGTQAESVEWRVFVQYDPGAFDAQTGLSHGWKETPRLRRVGISYLAPGQVLRSVER